MTNADDDAVVCHVCGSSHTPHCVLSYPHEHHKKRITIGEMFTNFGGTIFYYGRLGGSAGVYETSHLRSKCAYCGQWGDARSECGKCGAPIDETKTIVNHNAGYP